jgi:23S rRNA U2552 (ribose-2'-O)-methylase RlmE/FtsJ
MSNNQIWKNINWYTFPKSILVDILNGTNTNTNTNIINELNENLNDIDELMKLKDRISIFDEEKWEYSKKITNPFELIFTTSGKYPIPQSVCLLHPLSRSYFKMVEILYIINVWNIFKTSIRTAHVCEGPGGFIQAIYDTCERNRVKIMNTTAMTLKPTHFQVPGWKRASQFLKKNTQINVIYGKDGTGDILKEDNQDYFIDKTKRTINLFTADGGVDFTMNYKAQEETIFPLLIASTKIAIRCLVQGGIYILKLFDCNNPTTCDFILTLGFAFDKWAIYKPCTSRPCNSEQYFIGFGFRVSTFNTVMNILNMDLKWSNRFIGKIENKEFFNNFRNEQKCRINDQIVALNDTFNNINLNNKDIIKDLWKRNIDICKQFCNIYHLPTRTPLPEPIDFIFNNINDKDVLEIKDDE